MRSIDSAFSGPPGGGVAFWLIGDSLAFRNVYDAIRLMKDL